MKKIQKENKTSIFKSESFIKKVSQLDSNFISKYIFNLSFMFLLSTLSWILLVLTLSHVNTNLLVIRATLIFSTTWYLVFFVWWIIQTNQYFKLINNKTKWLAVFSFLPIVNFVMIGFLAKQIQKNDFGKWMGWMFTTNKFETNPNQYKSKQWYLNLATLIVMSPLLYFLFVYSKENDPMKDYHNLWFDGVHYFTIQTNLMCFIYVIMYVSCPKMNIFNNDSVLICLMSYIFIVSFTYNALLLPFTFKDLLIDDPKFIIKGMWTHTVNPFMFIGVGIACMHLNSKKYPYTRDYLTLLKFGMVIPTVYLIYTLFLPFMSDKSVYGPITNCNPNTPNNPPLFGLDYGTPIMLTPIIGFWFVFVGIITMFWRIKYSFNQKGIALMNVNPINNKKSSEVSC